MMHLRFAVIAALASATTVLAMAAAPAPLSPNWYAGGPQNDKFLAGVDPATDGRDAQFLLSKTSDPNAVGVLSQSIPAQDYLGQRVRFRARLRTRDLSNWGGLWMRVDGSDGKQLGFYNSQDKPIKGSTDWQERSVVLDVPPGAARIMVGVIGAGTGQIWMEPLDFGTVGREVPVDVFTHASPLGAVSGAMPPALAREVVNKTVELVESRGLYPRRQDEYVQAKAELLAMLDHQAGDIDRKDLYAGIQKLLLTLDTNGHSFLMPPGRQLQAQRPPKSQDDMGQSTLKLVTTGHGTVLRWAPPAITGSGEQGFTNYMTRFYDEAAAHPELAQACALVVDLSAQTGGNAWPPFLLMSPLFGDANKARWVDRDGKRRAFVNRAELESMRRHYVDGRTNPLTPFATGPLAVLVGERTASAGEMLLFALMGEDRVHTFGLTSAGMSTANMTYSLADGSILLLTTDRYALGDGPVYRGGIPPKHPAAAGEPWDATVKTAAEWAAANSPQCKARQPAIAQAE